MTTFDTLLESMKRRVPVRATYNGKPRLLCPHLLGETDGEQRGVFLQVGGESTTATTIPTEGAWRCMRLDRMTDVTLDEKETWRMANGWTGEFKELIEEVSAALVPESKGVRVHGRPHRGYAEPEAPEPPKDEPPCATYLEYIDLVLRLCTARTNQRERTHEDEGDSRYGHFARQRDLAKWARRDAEVAVMAKAVEAERASGRWDDAPLTRLAKEHGLEPMDEAALVYLAFSGSKSEGGFFDFFVPKAKGGKLAPVGGAQVIAAIASGRVGRLAARARLYADAPLRARSLVKAKDGAEGAPETMRFTITGALVRELLGHGTKGDVVTIEPGDDDEGLIRRMSPRFTLADVVLGQPEREAIVLAIAPARGGGTLPSGWGLDAKIKYGKGIGLIFAGPPGTGKTLAGEAIAGELKRPLFVVQVPELMGMFVGETQKNIAEVFQRARDEEGGAVLLFDEADSLFFDRTGASRSWEVQDVNVLLTEVERHEGVVIMTTNRKDALDPALCRRVSAVVDFPMPDAAARAEIWRHLLPPAARLAADVDVVALAKAAVMSGGEIKNAVLHAVRLASHRKVERIDQALLVEAANAITSGRWGALHEKRRAGFLGDG